MDFTTNLPIIIIAVIIVLQVIAQFRKRRGPGAGPEMIQDLLSEINWNLKFIESSQYKQRVRKFVTTRWQLSKDKLDFIDGSLQATLSDTYNMAQDLNKQIDAAKKHKSAAYGYDISMSTLEKPFEKSKQGLEEWLQENTEEKEGATKYPGLFDGLFGR